MRPAPRLAVPCCRILRAAYRRLDTAVPTATLLSCRPRRTPLTPPARRSMCACAGGTTTRPVPNTTMNALTVLPVRCVMSARSASLNPPARPPVPPGPSPVYPTARRVFSRLSARRISRRFVSFSVGRFPFSSLVLASILSRRLSSIASIHYRCTCTVSMHSTCTASIHCRCTVLSSVDAVCRTSTMVCLLSLSLHLPAEYYGLSMHTTIVCPPRNGASIKDNLPADYPSGQRTFSRPNTSASYRFIHSYMGACV